MDTLIASIFLGIIGSGYFMYGKKAHEPVPLVCGALLCVFPISSTASCGRWRSARC